MLTRSKNTHRTLEVILVLTVAALACLLYQTSGYKMIILNLYFLPVVLAAFFLGRYRSGILALFSVISASVIAVLDVTSFGTNSSPIVIGLAMTTWGAVLGLTAILVGTLSDERTAKVVELHEAYVGVVEVLSRYLQSATPELKDRSRRISELSQKVAEQLRLSQTEIDDIRVAALLQEMESIEITARVFRKAVGNLEEEDGDSGQFTFQGTDLARSLGSVLTGALPLIHDHSDTIASGSLVDNPTRLTEIPFGARIIRIVRAYEALVNSDLSGTGWSAQETIEELRREEDPAHDPAVLHALESVVAITNPAAQSQAASEQSPELLDPVGIRS